MSKDVKEAKEKLDENVVNLAEKISKTIVKGEDGNLTVPVEVFKENLPEGITDELAAKYVKHINTWGASVMLAGGKVAHQMFKDDEDLEKVVITSSMEGRSKAIVGYNRTLSGKLKVKGEEKAYNIPLASSLSFKFASSGNVKHVKTILEDMGQDLLKK